MKSLKTHITHITNILHKKTYTPYFGNSEPLEYIKGFLCTQPKEGDEDFDNTKGTRCERFLHILDNRKAFIKILNDYTDKFGETNGKYIFDDTTNNIANIIYPHDI